MVFLPMASKAGLARSKAPPGPAGRRQRLRDDFLAAVDGDGRVLDFHSWRSTYITGLVRSGASVKVTQQLARHSTPTLTLNLYGKLGVSRRTEALAKAREGGLLEDVAKT